MARPLPAGGDPARHPPGGGGGRWAQRLAAAGITIVEVPLNSPEPIESIRRLAKRFGGGMLVGAGTVMAPEQVAGGGRRRAAG